MEKMLETSLQQLTLEQKMRREAEGKCSVLEEKVKKLEIQLSQNEENFGRGLNKKDEKIINLEATTEFLQRALVEKDEELGRKEGIIKKLRSRIDIYKREHGGLGLDTVNNFEKRLSELIAEGKSKDESLTKTFPRTPGTADTPGLDAIEITPLERYCEAEAEASPQMDLVTEIKIEPKADDENNEEEEEEEIVIEGSAEVETQLTEDNWAVMETEDQDVLEHKTEEEEEEDEIKTEPGEGERAGREKHIKHKTHCKVCDSVFPNKHSLVQHEKESGHFLKFSCQHCDKRFRQKIQVKRHEAQVHSEEMPYQCNRCDRKFKSEFSWRRHQDNDEIHKRLENYTPFLTCSVCGKQFERRRKWCLDQHMLTHEPDNKFPCDICFKYFRTNNYLNTHKKACSGIKQEECAFCGKRFSKKTVLINHERLHTGERPYHCRLCDERFRTHHNYSLHGKNVHGALTASQFNLMQNEAETEKTSQPPGTIVIHRNT